MVGFPKILFPIDFSMAAPVVARHVAALAVKYNSEVHLIHVIPVYEHHNFASYGMVMEEIKQRAQGDLDVFTKEHLGGFKVSSAVLSGHTGRRILAYAEEHQISMIVMGTHGRTDFKEMMFGSVAQKVVQNASMPVMTINPAELMD